MARTQALSHVAMSVTPATMTEEWRAQVLDFYGEVFGWKEMDEFRLPDRLTISVGSTYINVRARDDAPAYSGYEHFGVAFQSADELRKAWDDASKHAAQPELEPLQDAGRGYLSFRLHYLLPLTIEAQFIPKPGA